ncbi:sensor histidine kinase [Pseudoalteromonas piscicida]|uniref:sensor histidine kinase n=1 Tax=Pseudoalteromonas piscicida TaxID=43662 RepID=UPI000E35C368|nr:sensor histidine kinase [Pseudoalteromonas piscicida]AXQ98794.1 GHKL domain-containing protein [Pseudoalteromonas piscicida]
MDINSLLTELKNLRPDKQIEKLKEIAKSVTSEQISTIEAAAREANQPWLSSALQDIASSNKQGPLKPTQHQIEEGTDDLNAIRSEAVSDSIGQIIHELEPIVGSIKLLAKSEVNDFESSGIKHELMLLDELLETFENWKKVEQPPNYKETNLFEIIEKEWSRLKKKSTVDLTINISKELTFNLDPSLFRIICSNALRNSIEACKEPTVRIKKPILINSNTTNNSLWLSIIDNGLGLQEKSEELMKSRFTTKPGNQGLGLALINKAIKQLNGNWELTNSETGGAQFSFEIPKREL